MSWRSSITWALLIAAPGGAGSAEAAVLSGTVTVTERGGEAGDPSGAIVWLEGGPGGTPAAGRATIDTRNKSFEPEVISVPAGSTVSFPNADPILHNVFSVSGENGFDLGLYGQGEGREVVLRNPGIVRVFCNVHPQMEAIVVVTPDRRSARVSADGSFKIADLPAGRYEVRVWERRSGLTGRDIELAAEESMTLEFRLDASNYRRRPHLDKHGRPYVGRERY